VAGIGEQRQGAGQNAAGDLGDHEPARQQGGEPDTALVGRVAVVMAVRVIMAMAMIIVIVRVRVGMLHSCSRANGSTRELTHSPSAGIMAAVRNNQRASDRTGVI
jgi:hypothetical protein